MGWSGRSASFAARGIGSRRRSHASSSSSRRPRTVPGSEVTNGGPDRVDHRSRAEENELVVCWTDRRQNTFLLLFNGLGSISTECPSLVGAFPHQGQAGSLRLRSATPPPIGRTAVGGDHERSR